MVDRESRRSPAQYDHWMNERLHAADARLDDGERRADPGAFVGPIHGAPDLCWMPLPAAAAG